MNIVDKFFDKFFKKTKNGEPDCQHRIDFAPTWWGCTEIFPLRSISRGLVLVVGSADSQKTTVLEIHRNKGFRIVGNPRTESEWSDTLEKARDEKIATHVDASDIRPIIDFISSQKRDGIFIGVFSLCPVSREDATLAREAGIRLGAIMWSLADIDQLRDCYTRL